MDGCRATGVVSTRETSERLTDVIVIFIVDVDNKKKVSTFVIDCAKPVRIVVEADDVENPRAGWLARSVSRDLTEKERATDDGIAF